MPKHTLPINLCAACSTHPEQDCYRCHGAGYVAQLARLHRATDHIGRGTLGAKPGDEFRGMRSTQYQRELERLTHGRAPTPQQVHLATQVARQNVAVLIAPVDLRAREIAAFCR